jgi:hypothetical protein
MRQKYIFRAGSPMQERRNRLCSTPSLFLGVSGDMPGVRLVIHHRLVPRIIMSAAILQLTKKAFVASTKITLPSTFTNNSIHVFHICVSVHHQSILLINQLDVTLCSLIYSLLRFILHVSGAFCTHHQEYN